MFLNLKKWVSVVEGEEVCERLEMTNTIIKQMVRTFINATSQKQFSLVLLFKKKKKNEFVKPYGLFL